MNIFRYVVRFDGGSAPRPYGDICTLAICKPMIRRTASIGDWIIGVRSKAHTKVVYVMQVSKVVPFSDYWSDPRFVDRRPGASPVPDNIYRPSERGELVQEPNPIHDSSEKTTDLSGRNVLVGNRFWYFGSESPVLPMELMHLVPYYRGHSRHINRRQSDAEHLERWLKGWSCGIHGMPIEATEELRGWLLNSELAVEEEFNRPIPRCGKQSRVKPSRASNRS